MNLVFIAVIGAYLLALVVLGYAIHLSVIYQRFNDGIKDWANALDASSKEAINRSARQILRELDEKISRANENENVEPLNNDKDE